MPSTTERVALRGYRQFGARQSEAGALRNALAYAGVVAPHTGQAFTEEMLFGLGGSAFRPLYADFLEEAGTVLNRRY